MKPTSNTACSDENLQRLLQEDEDSDAYRSALRHVDQCTSCQIRLEQLAADQQAWQQARVVLAAGKGEGEPASAAAAGDATQRWQYSNWLRRPTAWTESMAQQLLSPGSHPEMLGRIGRYDVERLIGAGGMGIVFKAFDTELNRPVAVKVLAPYLAGSGAARKRFAREARAAAAVVHEHVVAIHNVESDGEAPFLVMQFVAGQSLQQRLDRDGPLQLREVLRIAMQTAAGLAAAHAQGLVHRDVKPSNILLEEGVERALLTDFGLARASDDASLTHTGYHPGTPQYMSPEQARGDQVDARSDLFSLGSVIYAMCTGRPPFRAETSYGILRRITDTEPRPMRSINPEVPEWLEWIVGRLHAKSAADRFQSADEVHELLEQCLAHVQQPTAVPLPTGCRPMQSRLATLSRKYVRSAAIFVTLALLIPLVIVARFALVGDRSATQQQTAGDTALPANSSSEPADIESSTDWESVAERLDAFRENLEPFEMNAHQPFEDLRPAIQE